MAGLVGDLCIATNVRPASCKSGHDSLKISGHPQRIAGSVMRLGGTTARPHITSSEIGLRPAVSLIGRHAVRRPTALWGANAPQVWRFTRRKITGHHPLRDRDGRAYCVKLVEMTSIGAMMDTLGDTGQARPRSRRSLDVCFFSPGQIPPWMT